MDTEPMEVEPHPDHQQAAMLAVAQNGRGQAQSLSPLAPLEYLQNQRRGSITDPSLHAHMSTPPFPSSSSQSSSAKEVASPRPKNAPIVTRPTSPYVFGDATPTNHTTHAPPPADKNLRRLLHSPNEASGSQSAFRSFSDPQKPPDALARAMSNPPEPQPSHLARRRSDDLEPKDVAAKLPFPAAEAKDNMLPPGFDWGMRRHSIATGALSGHSNKSPGYSRSLREGSSGHGIKRKLSFERVQYPPLNEEGDNFTQGVPPDADLPALKTRRGSAFDTQRIASLSLYERRDSLDSRLTGSASTNQSPQQFWDNRRDSVTSTFSNLSSVGGYTSSGFSGDISNRLQQFAWPPPSTNNANPGMSTPPISEAPHQQHEVDTHMAGPGTSTSGQFDPRSGPTMAVHTLPPTMHTMGDAERRMSIPDVTLSPGGGDRPRRIRPRPGSRGREASGANASAGSIPPMPPQIKAPNSTASIPPSEPSPQSGSSAGDTMGPHGSSARDGSLPYSRSPELRVSHKLAERKRRKEMKELFDELRDQLPADRSMKASKWEILSKAIDHIHLLSNNLQESQRQVEMMRMELEKSRTGYSINNPPIVHSQGPTIVTTYPGDMGSAPTSASSIQSRGPHPYSHMNGRRSPPH